MGRFRSLGTLREVHTPQGTWDSRDTRVCGHAITVTGAKVANIHPLSYGGFIRFSFVLVTVCFSSIWLLDLLYKGEMFLFVSFEAKYI